MIRKPMALKITSVKMRMDVCGRELSTSELGLMMLLRRTWLRLSPSSDFEDDELCSKVYIRMSIERSNQG